ncbi:MAG: hypothetical protein ACQEWE_16145 [Bacillota bacterium]
MKMSIMKKTQWDIPIIMKKEDLMNLLEVGKTLDQAITRKAMQNIGSVKNEKMMHIFTGRMEDLVGKLMRQMMT